VGGRPLIHAGVHSGPCPGPLLSRIVPNAESGSGRGPCKQEVTDSNPAGSTHTMQFRFGGPDQCLAVGSRNSGKRLRMAHSASPDDRHSDERSWEFSKRGVLSSERAPAHVANRWT
jgi:hypothetical protein